jgi:hypothetical protein
MGSELIIDALGHAVNQAATHAVHNHESVILRRDGEQLLGIVPDTLILELLANGIPVGSADVMYWTDGRRVRVIPF